MRSIIRCSKCDVKTDVHAQGLGEKSSVFELTDLGKSSLKYNPFSYIKDRQ